MAGFDFTMQLQVGCPGGCLFCYVSAGRFLAPMDVKGEGGREWGFQVRNKEQALSRFARHLEAEHWRTEPSTGAALPTRMPVRLA